MSKDRTRPRALFLSAGGVSLPDNVVCSGLKLPELRGRACLYSDGGRFPLPHRSRFTKPNFEGKSRPPCAISQLGRLEEWRGVLGKHPQDMRSMLVFKCKQMFLFVIPGLHADSEPNNTIKSAPED